MLPYRDSKLTKIALAVFFLIIAGYAYFEARGMLFGPKINISSSVTEVTEPFIRIQGKADRIATLRMNGREIAVTEEGAFDEPYLLSPGINRIVFEAKDKYGRSRERVLQVVYIASPGAAGESAAATTTGATSTEDVVN